MTQPEPCGLFINGVRDYRFDGKCTVCGHMTRNDGSHAHRHPGVFGSVYDKSGRILPTLEIKPPPFGADIFICPFCLSGRCSFSTGAHSEPICPNHRDLETALREWAKRLDGG